MGRFVEAVKTTELPAGNMRAVELEGQDVLLANINGNFYAISNKCPHMGGNLSKGKLEGSIVTCPLHGSQFDISTGKVIRWLKGSGILSSIGKTLKAPQDARKYPVKIESDTVLVLIEKT
ncbi:MAG: non-heme iron oxygenase ferredoxin subunit [Dehalococcoidia bacterium]|nr:non-heme iron oxygenase ferredoxin subunit [Dehalococcoidia bacterium]MDD5494883.1 non-heme iron oxygenase ferredoxin subunit [Dehalococcoidia bacterium]